MEKFNTQRDPAFRPWLIAALFFALLLGACNTIRFTYNQGDRLLYWWINAYIDLDSEQSDWAKGEIDKLFAWHRRTQLPDYAALLQKGQQQLARGMTQQDLLDDIREVRTRGERLLLRSAPELTDLARSIKPEQVQNLREKFERNNREYRKKYMGGSMEQRQKVRYKKAMEQLRLWFGDFSKTQEAAIRQLSDARPLDQDAWLQERVWRQQKILDLVRRVQSQRMDKAQAQAAVEATIRETFARLDSSERKAFYDAYLDSSTRFYVAVIKMTTPQQREHAHKRMQGWIDDFRSLAAEKKR